MKKIVIIRLLLVSMLFLNSCKFLSGEAGYKYDLQNIIFRITEPKGDKKINDSVFNGYIKSKYGILSDKLIVKFIGNRSEADIHGVHGWYYHDWVRAYSIIAPFMSKPFEVWIDNRTHKVFGDNFYEVLTSDEKFQHLYSEWVKKQIGCEDENIELGFTGHRRGFSIDFNSIKTLNNDYDELFRNVKCFYFWFYQKSNIIDLKDSNKESLARGIINKYTKDIIKITNLPESKIVGRIDLSSGNFDRNKDKNYEFFFNLVNINDELEERKY